MSTDDVEHGAHLPHLKTSKPHPYLHGNFAPIQRVQPLTPCSYTGSIPQELAGGEYVRNGGNPVTNEDLGRDAHWFDGDGMLSGVAFTRSRNGLGEEEIVPHFVNQYILTDVYLSTLSTPQLRLPILPSIATLVNPASSLILIVARIFRTIFLVLLSHLPGSKQAIRKISVANTGILWHDGRALATCESGPPMRVSLPGLETVGWFDGWNAEGEGAATEKGEGRPMGKEGAGFGGDGLLSFMKEWTTAHPRIDPVTKELILFHSTFFAPFVYYSIVPSTFSAGNAALPSRRRLNAPIPGIKSAKMMHDFGVSLTHTVIMDLPLSLDPRNLLRNEPVVSYDPSGRSRFGVFPRWQPESVRWFETSPCCIFHTANTWDETSTTKSLSSPSEVHTTTAVNMLACRLTSAALVFSAGDVAAPVPKRTSVELEEEQCRLYYYRFDLASASNTISHQFALSAIPFEFPSLRDDVSMTDARYIYGCSVSDASFGAALGRAVKIDSLVKLDVRALIAQGKASPPSTIVGCVDTRTVAQILATQALPGNEDDPIKVFKMPAGWYAQESRFVPRKGGVAEDDGYLLAYVFDEAQLDGAGNALRNAKSELWVVDARTMGTVGWEESVVARVTLPQRVPYGLHGNWFSEEEVVAQRPLETIRALPVVGAKATSQDSVWSDLGLAVRRWMLEHVA